MSDTTIHTQCCTAGTEEGVVAKVRLLSNL